MKTLKELLGFSKPVGTEDFEAATASMTTSIDEDRYNEEINLANALIDELRYSEAFPLCQKLAELGVVKAQHYLGRMYANGEGVSQDNKQSYAWLSVALMNGADVSSMIDEVRGLLTAQELSEAEGLAQQYYQEYGVK